MDRAALHAACFQPAPYLVDQARVADPMLDKPEQPLV
jgi:hypothetical protein